MHTEKKSSKDLIPQLFAHLDLISMIWKLLYFSGTPWLLNFAAPADNNILYALRLFFYLSLPIGAYFLLRRRKSGYIIYLCQLPLRWYFNHFTFYIFFDLFFIGQALSSQIFALIILYLFEAFRVIYSVYAVLPRSNKNYLNLLDNPPNE